MTVYIVNSDHRVFHSICNKVALVRFFLKKNAEIALAEAAPAI